MHALRPECMFKLSLMKYETNDDGNPVAERILSTSWRVKMKITWPDDRYRMSLARYAIYLVKQLRWISMTWGNGK